jgi:hypothetical protein
MGEWWSRSVFGFSADVFERMFAPGRKKRGVGYTRKSAHVNKRKRKMTRASRKINRGK